MAFLLVGSTSIALAGTRPPAPNDVFTGAISSAMGGFKADHARVRLSLRPAPSTSSVRLVTVRVSTLPCRVRKRCLELSGVLTGTLALQPASMPDTGATFALQAAGTLSRIGRAAITGTVESPGFIASGRERLHLNLTAARGRVTIDASSDPVPGFTAPSADPVAALG
jgi:hypothetical protein